MTDLQEWLDAWHGWERALLVRLGDMLKDLEDKPFEKAVEHVNGWGGDRNGRACQALGDLQGTLLKGGPIVIDSTKPPPPPFQKPGK